MLTRTWLSAALGGALLTAMSMTGPLATAAVAYGTSADGIVPEYVAGNPSCTVLGYAHGTKWDYPADSEGGTYPLGSGAVTWSTDGTYVDWSSDFGVDAVIVKGGPNANSYVYDPPAESFGDENLVSPLNNSEPYGLSHVEFCYDYELDVTKTADTTFTRTYSWDIDKVGSQTSLVLSRGQQFLVDYDVTVGLDEVTPYVDSDFAVSGTISVTNPDPTLPATLAGVTDSISGDPLIAAAVQCPAGDTLLPGESLTCTYQAALPDGTQRTNTATATVTSTSMVKTGTGTADVTFGEPTTLVDECVSVSDTLQGSLGTACVGDLPKTFEYTMQIGPYADCGTRDVTNVASFLTGDQGLSESDSWTVAVDVPCGDEGGCTLTQGYWKTHSKYGPAPYDDTWMQLGEDTAFFGSGKTYYQVMWTAPGGDAYYILAQQYVAAVLNGYNEADVPGEVQAAMSGAEALFAKTSWTKKDVAMAKTLAMTLDGYNNGLTGPGHCSE